MRGNQSGGSNFIKYLSLVLLVLQTSSVVLLLRYSRTVPTKTESGEPAKRYLTSTAVVNGEILKTLTCVVLVWAQTGKFYSPLVSHI